MEYLPSLKYLSVDLDFVALDKLKFPPFKGTTLRGAFGTAFKKTVCVTHKPLCKDCVLYETCVYSYVFETPMSSEEGLPQKTPFAPHPFVITPPIDSKMEYEQGEKLTFHLTLFGRAVNLLPYFILTFEVMGNRGITKTRGKTKLISVKQYNKIIYTDGKFISKPQIKDVREFLPFTEAKGELTMQFLTPVRLIYRGKLLDTPDFVAIRAAILRRFFWILKVHSEHTDLQGLTDWDNFGTILRKVRGIIKPVMVSRYSMRQKRRMAFKGFIGEVVYSGSIGRYLPLLRVGEVLHIGKATSFGFGKYKIKEVKYG